MAAPKKKSRPVVIPLSAAEKADLVKFRESLDEVGRKLFDIAMSVPQEELMSTDEILAEIAWRRGDISYQFTDAREDTDLR